jgi:hypothetical protein
VAVVALVASTTSNIAAATVLQVLSGRMMLASLEVVSGRRRSYASGRRPDGWVR